MRYCFAIIVHYNIACGLRLTFAYPSMPIIHYFREPKLSLIMGHYICNNGTHLRHHTSDITHSLAIPI